MTSPSRSVSGSPASQVDFLQLASGLENVLQENVLQDVQEKTQAAYKKCKEKCEGIIGLIQGVQRPKVTGQIGLGDVSAGAAAALLVGLVSGSLVCAAPAAISGIYAYHNCPPISAAVKSCISSTSQLVQGITPPQQKPMEAHEAVCLSFDRSSSGFLGSLAGRPSETVGDFRINLGEGEELSCRFNFKNANRISEEDQNELFQILYQKVDENKLCPKRCIEILDGFNRLYHPIKGNEVTAIDDLPLFEALRELCNAKIALNSTEEINMGSSLIEAIDTQLKSLQDILKVESTDTE